MKDKNDTVKIDILNIIILNMMNFIYELITKLSEDQNWRVRLTVIDNLTELLKFPNISYQFKQIAIYIFIK